MTRTRRTRSAVLAVDGGNSKTDMALVASDGELLGALRGPTVSHQAVGLDEGLRRLGELAGRIALGRGESRTGPVAEVGIYALAGADLPSDFQMLRSGLKAVGLSQSIVVANDATAALRAGTRRGWGIALVCGAGVNAYGRNPNGRSARFAGLGDTTGDWGGGGSIGLAALGAAVRARDGRSSRTILEQVVPAHFGLRRPVDVAAAFESGHLDYRRFDDLAPLVFQAAAAGDQAARDIIDRQSAELATMAHALARRLGLIKSDVDIVLTGGVFKSYDDGLLSDLTSRVRVRVPGAQLIKVRGPAVVGAALLGLDLVAKGVVRMEIESRVRAALNAWQPGGEE